MHFATSAILFCREERWCKHLRSFQSFPLGSVLMLGQMEVETSEGLAWITTGFLEAGSALAMCSNISFVF